MLKEFVSYLLEMNRPEIVDVDGVKYSTRSLNKLNVEHDISALKLRSLSGLIDYVKSNFDTDTKQFMIHVESPTTVSLYDPLNPENDRRQYIKTTALLPNIQFDRFLNREAFNIQLQSMFIQTPELEKVLKFVGSVSEEQSKDTTDNGVSQKVVAKVGVATVDTVEVPNPVYLKPFRTFVEVEQPISAFVLRMKEGPAVALFEADGAAWEINAMHNIKEYLNENLTDEIDSGRVIIIA